MAASGRQQSGGRARGPAERSKKRRPPTSTPAPTAATSGGQPPDRPARPPASSEPAPVVASQDDLTSADDATAPDAAGDTSPGADDAPAGTPKVLRAAAVILAVEALALLGVAAFLGYGAVADHPVSAAGAAWGALLCLAGAAALVAGARGLLHRRSGARTPMVVLQIIAIPIAYTVGFSAGRISVGGPLLVAALAVIYLLFTPPARAALDRDHTF